MESIESLKKFLQIVLCARTSAMWTE